MWYIQAVHKMYSFVNPIHSVHVEHKSSWKMTICTILFNYLLILQFLFKSRSASLEIVISLP